MLLKIPNINRVFRRSSKPAERFCDFLWYKRIYFILGSSKKTKLKTLKSESPLTTTPLKTYRTEEEEDEEDEEYTKSFFKSAENFRVC